MILVFFSINVLSLALPISLKKIYSSIIVDQSVVSLQFILVFVLVALILESIMRYVKETSSKWIATKYELLLSQFLVEKILNRFNDGRKNFISNIEKFKTITKLTNFASKAYYQLWIDLPFSILFFFLIYLYGGYIVLIPLILALIYALIVFFSMFSYFKSQSDYVEKMDLQIERLIDALDKIHLIKSSGLEESQFIKFKKTIDEVSIQEYQTNLFKVTPNTLSQKISQLSFFMVLIAGGYLLSQNMISFGQITACALLSNRALSPVISMMRYFQQTQDIKVIKERLYELAESSSQYSEDTPYFPNEIMGALEFVNLGYTNVQTGQLMEISASIEPREFISIDPAEFPSYKEVLNKISGRVATETGMVLIDSLNISEWNLHHLKGKLEYLDDNVPIFKGSVIENITYFDPSQTNSGFESAALTGLNDIVTMMPEGFETQLDSHMLNYLSSGFLQRLNLSRALLSRPRILILDRIDESMDEDTLKLFTWLLESFKGQMTIILVSWQKSLLRTGDFKLTPQGKEVCDERK
jgi:ABC-type bacteriocin/lantibiotic exporter with double-glycine peptidase domain